MATPGNQQDYTFDILLKSWMLSPFSDRYKDVTTIILPGSLIPPLTAKVEQSFSLMKPICTRLRNRVLTKNLSHCIRICKSWDLKADEYEQILRFIAITMTSSFLYMFNFFYLLCFCFLISSNLKRKKKVPAVTTPNALHGVVNFFFPLKSLFAIKLKSSFNIRW